MNIRETPGKKSRMNSDSDSMQDILLPRKIVQIDISINIT